MVRNRDGNICSRCHNFVDVDPDYDFDNDTDVCSVCAYDVINELKAKLTGLLGENLDLKTNIAIATKTLK